MPKITLPTLGFGLGLRVEHYEDILGDPPEIDWFEALTENYLVPGGKPLHYLMRVRERYPVALHGVSMSIGSTAPLDLEYFAQLKALAAHVQPAWISDHLCWTGVSGRNTHDLLPLPYTDEAVMHVASRVRTVQDILGTRILLENVSSYVTFRDSRLTEWEFLRAVAEESDCLILLDVNNVYVSSVKVHGEGAALPYAVAAAPAHGTLSGTAPALIYTPAANYSGADSFTVAGTVRSSGTGTGTVDLGDGDDTFTIQDGADRLRIA